jgi:hypothetical protein
MSGDLRSHKGKCALGAGHCGVLAILLEVPFKLSLFEALLTPRVVCALDLVLCAVEVQVVVQEPSLDELIARLAILIDVFTLFLMMVCHCTLSHNLPTVGASHREVLAVEDVLLKEGV